MAKETMVEGVDYCRTLKTIHKGFFSATFRTVDERLVWIVIYCYE